MPPSDMSLDLARKVADAVLYEGYVLYPYRASALKNRRRWQWGVLVPRPQSDAAGEAWAAQTEVLVETGSTVRVSARCLQLETCAGEAPWDEGVEQEVLVEAAIDGPRVERSFVLPSVTGEGRCREEVTGRLIVATEKLGDALVRVRIRIENLTDWHDPAATRDQVVLHSLVGAHVLASLDNGRFLSLVDPPESARDHAARCEQIGLWPVLVGDSDDLLLAAPIILEERPQIAPESRGDLYDGTEIDELLALRTLTLTDDEKAEARATDPRAAAIIDRVHAMSGDVLKGLHGVMRDPWWDPAADAGTTADTVVIDGGQVMAGSKVRLAPRRDADAQDMFLEGRTATVEAVLCDVDGEHHLAVTLDDDPGADLLRAEGRFLYFRPDEVTRL